MKSPSPEAVLAKQMSRVNPAIWVQEALRLRDRKVSFAEHVWQIEPLTIECPRVTVRKATQGGWTQLFLWLVFHLLRFGRAPQGAIYMLPSQQKAYRFSQSRIGTIIDDNPIAIGRHVRRTNNVLLRQIHKTFLFILWGTLNLKIRGMDKESEALRGDPADAVFEDESDLMDQVVCGKVHERMSHSRLRWSRRLSNPTVPGYGIDADYQESDQRVLHMRCERCNEWTAPDLEFPDCIRPDANGILQRACVNCGRGPLNLQLCEWVPTYPDRSEEHVGYWWSQLASPFVSAKEILDAYKDPNKMAPGATLSDVYRLKLGRPHVAAKDKLTADQVLSCCRDYAAITQSSQPTAIGIDVGNLLHVVAGQPLEGGGARVLAVMTFEGDQAWELAMAFAASMRAQVQVIDAEPEMHAARKYQAKAKGEVWVCQYNHQVRGYHYDKAGGVVSVNRTEILDETHWAATYPGKLRLPFPTSLVQEFGTHMSNMAKIPQEDAETGAIRYEYAKLGPDHFRHAFGYMLLACKRMSPVAEVPQLPAPEVRRQDYDLFG